MRYFLILWVGLCVSTNATFAQEEASANAADGLPVREVTVFKDGHAYVVREAALAADAGGRVTLDELPTPVLGTFWPFAYGDGARLISAKAGRQSVTEQRPVASVVDAAMANVGRDVVLLDHRRQRMAGRLVKATAEVVMLRTTTGLRVTPVSHVHDLEVLEDFVGDLATERERDRLVLEVEGGGASTKVGVMYVQQGLRWIPSYRLEIDGEGKAVVRLQATLVNDLIDLQGVAVHLVIGVPKFEFADLKDPISLQQEVATVAPRAPSNAMFSNRLSNSLMTQSVAGYVPSGQVAAGQGSEAGRNEDLFVFTVRDITLRKGERMVVPISTFELEYRDVYTLEIPFSPPMEMRQNLQSERVFELAKELAAPKAMHVLRLINDSEAPLTTAPVLVLNKGRVLAQGRVRYTPIGATTDLEINAAIDICVDRSDQESGRAEQALKVDRESYGRIDLTGLIELRNDKRTSVEIEVTRGVLGRIDRVGQEGKARQLDLAGLWDGRTRPGWWSWWSWPYWWFRFNGFGEIRWVVKLEPGEAVELDYAWHYFWR